MTTPAPDSRPRRPRPTLHRAPSDRPYFSADGESYLAQTTLRELTKSRPLRVLSEADFAHWQTYGYVIVREAIPAPEARRLLDFTWEFQGLDPDRPDTWHEDRPFRSELDQQLHVYGFVEAYHHQLLWDSRQAQRVYDAFVDVWDCEELWVTLDRLNLNPPNVKNRDRALIDPTDRGFDIELHWDIDTTLGVPRSACRASSRSTTPAPSWADSSATRNCSGGSRSGRPPSPRAGTRCAPMWTAPNSPSSGPNCTPATC